MADYDGSIKLGVELDTDSVDKDAFSLKRIIEDIFKSIDTSNADSKFNKMALSMKSTYKTAEELTTELEKWRSIETPTEEYEELEKRIKKNNDAFDKLLIKQDELMEKGITSGKGWDTLNSAMEVLGTYIREDEAELQRLVDTGKDVTIGNPEKVAKVEKQLDIVNDKMRIQVMQYQEAKEKMEEQAKAEKEIAKNTDKANKSTKDQSKHIMASSDSAKKLSNQLKAVSFNASKAGASFKKMAKTLAGVVLGAVGLTAIIRKLVSFGKEGFGNLVKELNKGTIEAQYNMDLLRAKTVQVKNAVGAIVAPLFNKVVPVIAKIADFVTYIFNTITKIIGQLTNNKIVATAKILGAEEGKKLDEYGKQDKTQAAYQKEVTKAQTAYEKELAKYQDKVTKTEEKQAKAAAKLAKQQEKANKQLAGFDELNNLNSQSIDDQLASLEDYMEGLEEPVLELPEVPEDMFTMFEEVNPSDELPQWLKKLLSLLKPLKDRLLELYNIGKKGFFDGLGGDYKERISDIIDNITGIKTALIDIWTDPKVIDAINRYVKSVAYFWGSLLGSITSIVLTITQNITGGIEKWLESDGPFLKQSIADIFNVWSTILNQLSRFFQDFADIFSVFSSGSGKQITADLLGIFIDPLVFILEYASKFISDLLSIVLDPIHEHKDDIKNILQDTLDFLSGVTSFVKGIVDKILEIIGNLYDKHVKPLMDNIKSIVDDVFTGIAKVWNDTLKPVLDKIRQDLPELQAIIEPVLEEIGELVGVVIDFISEDIKALWELLKPIFAWIHEHIGPIFKALLLEGWKFLKQTIEDVMNILKPLISFIKNLFKLVTDLIKGDWKAAWGDFKNIGKDALNFVMNLMRGFSNFFSGIWEGLVNVFKPPMNSLLSGVETLINGICDGFNFLIDWLNNLQIDIPDWVPHWGGNSISFNLGHFGNVQLPRLAQGQVVPPRMQEYAAILGDNNQETEVVSPLSTMKQAMIEALTESGIGGSRDTGDIVVQIDGREVFRAVRNENNSFINRTGRSAFVY